MKAIPDSYDFNKPFLDYSIIRYFRMHTHAHCGEKSNPLASVDEMLPVLVFQYPKPNID